MSRKPIVEEVSEDEFDDDTDLPLPKRTLPNTGTRGALLEEMDIPLDPVFSGSSMPGTSKPATMGGSTPALPGFVPQSQSKLQQLASGHAASGGMKHIEPDSPEAEKFKKWTCVYPVYIDAKRAYGTGGRKIAREKSVWWPKSLDMANAAHSIGLLVLHEPLKSHPRDWENPGRIKVLWKNDGRLTNSNIPTKKLLFEMISAQLQRTKPSQMPDMSKLSVKDMISVRSQPDMANLSVGSKYKSTKGGNDVPKAGHTPRRRRRRPLPTPPQPFPPIQDRFSMYSPLLSSNVLLEAWKVGTEKTPGGEGSAAAPGAMGKGKRKVIRVRG